MNTTQCRYQIGQRVEVLLNNWSVPGFPEEWFPGQVFGIQSLDAGRWDVIIRTDADRWSPQIVGPRGGNKHIRPATS